LGSRYCRGTKLCAPTRVGGCWTAVLRFAPSPDRSARGSARSRVAPETRRIGGQQVRSAECLSRRKFDGWTSQCWKAKTSGRGAAWMGARRPGVPRGGGSRSEQASGRADDGHAQVTSRTRTRAPVGAVSRRQHPRPGGRPNDRQRLRRLARGLARYSSQPAPMPG
jgi:hypothetical protein